MTLFLKTSFLAYSFAPDFNSLCVFYTGASCSTVASYVHHGRIGYSLGRHGYVIKERCIDTLQHLFIRSNVATNTVSVFLGVAHRKDRSRWKLDWLCLFVFFVLLVQQDNSSSGTGPFENLVGPGGNMSQVRFLKSSLIPLVPYIVKNENK